LIVIVDLFKKYEEQNAALIILINACQHTTLFSREWSPLMEGWIPKPIL